jgi:hypothetical protein
VGIEHAGENSWIRLDGSGHSVRSVENELVPESAVV